MHKLLKYVCDEMKDLESKVENGGKLSMAEIQYGDTLAHFKKNLLTADAMENSSRDSSSRRPLDTNDYSYRDDSSYRRDAMGRYSRDEDEIKSALRKLMDAYNA